MTLSFDGLRLLKALEGCSNTVYLDSGGAPTIGIGHLITKDERMSGKIWIGSEWVRYADGLTDEQVDALCLQDIRYVDSCISRWVSSPLIQCQYDALLSFVFNVGNGAFIHSTLLKRLNLRHYDEVPPQMMRWVHDNGKVVMGLVRRREREAAMWRGELQ